MAAGIQFLLRTSPTCTTPLHATLGLYVQLSNNSWWPVMYATVNDKTTMHQLIIPNSSIAPFGTVRLEKHHQACMPCIQEIFRRVVSPFISNVYTAWGRTASEVNSSIPLRIDRSLGRRNNIKYCRLSYVRQMPWVMSRSLPIFTTFGNASNWSLALSRKRCQL
jgi:hypothetical protein